MNPSLYSTRVLTPFLPGFLLVSAAGSGFFVKYLLMSAPHHLPHRLLHLFPLAPVFRKDVSTVTFGHWQRGWPGFCGPPFNCYLSLLIRTPFQRKSTNFASQTIFTAYKISHWGWWQNTHKEHTVSKSWCKAMDRHYTEKWVSSDLNDFVIYRPSILLTWTMQRNRGKQ